MVLLFLLDPAAVVVYSRWSEDSINSMIAVSYYISSKMAFVRYASEELQDIFYLPEYSQRLFRSIIIPPIATPRIFSIHTFIVLYCILVLPRSSLSFSGRGLTK